ncbi:MAG: spermidine synthase [Gemmataceae bacterium]
MHTLYDASGQHCWITVRESPTTRYLELHGCEEGAMFLRSEEPVFRYLWFHKASWLAESRAARLLVLGAGAFTAPKCLALDHPHATVDAVDIEADLFPVAKRFFRLDQHAYRNVQFHGCGADEFLAQAGSYDFVFDDLFDGFLHVPSASRTLPHFERMAHVLAEGGVCVKNVIWDPKIADTRAACQEAENALRRVFPSTLVLALGNVERGHNRLLIGKKLPGGLDWSRALDQLLKSGMSLDILQATRTV